MSYITEAAPPCQIHTKHSGTFVCVNVNAFERDELGVFATGCWINYPNTEESVYIYNEQILYISYDFEALQQWQSAELDALEEKATELVDVAGYQVEIPEDPGEY